MRTRASYGSTPSGWGSKNRKHKDGGGKSQRKIAFLNPERYPLYIGNKFVKSVEKEHVPKKYSSSNGRARLISAITMVLYHMSSAPLMPLLSRYLIGRWSSVSEQNVTVSPNENPCNSDDWIRDHDATHNKVTDEMVYYRYAVSIPAIASTMLLGSYGDVVGRKPILLVTLCGSLVKLILFILTIRFDLNTNVFFAAFGVDGLTGSTFVISIAFFAMAADVHAEKTSRALWIAFLVGLEFLTISIVTFLVIDYLVPALGTMLTSCLLLVPLLVAILLTIFLLPETFPKPSERTLTPWSRLSRVFKIYTSEGTCTKHMALFVALVILSLLEVNVLGPRYIDTLYLSTAPFCWTHDQTHIYATARLAGQSVAAVLLLRLIYWKGCVTDEKLAVGGTLFQGASFILEALASSSWMIMIVPIVGFPGFVSVPIVETAMSFLVGRHDQGALFAGIAAKEALSNAVAYTSLNRVYTQTADINRGAIYLILASISVLAFLLFFLFNYLYHRILRKELSLEESHNGNKEQEKSIIER